LTPPPVVPAIPRDGENDAETSIIDSEMNLIALRVKYA